jgi:hypothetical protein
MPSAGGETLHAEPIRVTEDTGMCMNCGCGEPNDRHGNDANITMDDLRRAGEANNQDVDQVMGNMEQAYHASEESRQVAQGHGHSY